MVAIRADEIVVSMRLDIADYTQNLRLVDATSQRAFKGIGQGVVKSSNIVLAALRRLGKGFSVAESLLDFIPVDEFADTTTRIRRLLALARQETGVNVATFEDIFSAAAGANVGLEKTADLYVRLAIAAAGLGLEQKQLSAFIVDFSKALKAGGADVAKVETGVASLARTLRAGRFDGAALGSLIQGNNGKALRDALSRQLGVTGEEELSEFLANRDVSIETLINALERNRPAVERALGASSKTTAELKKAVEIIGGGVAGQSESFQVTADVIRDGIDKVILFLKDALLGDADKTGTADARSVNDSAKADFLQQIVNTVAKADRLITKEPATGEAGAGEPPRSVPTPPVNEKQLELLRQLLRLILAQTSAVGAQATAIENNARQRKTSIDVEKSELELRKAGIPVTEQLRKSLGNLAETHTQLAASTQATAISEKEFAATLAELDAIARDALGGFIDDLRNGESAADALENALRRIEDRLIDIALNAIFSNSGGGLFGGLLAGASGTGGLFSFKNGGPVKRFAAGGLVAGPGSGRSDGIPALLSNGEFVATAQATKNNRPLLEAINAGSFNLKRLRGFADGGIVSAEQFNNRIASSDIRLAPRPTAGAAESPVVIEPQVNLRNINAFDADDVVTQALSGPAGEKALLNMVRARPSAFRGALNLNRP